jgi:hypothetical protein
VSRRDDNRTAMQGSSLGKDTIWGREEEIKLGEVVRVSDFKPRGFVGVDGDSGVGGRQ